MRGNTFPSVNENAYIEFGAILQSKDQAPQRWLAGLSGALSVSSVALDAVDKTEPCMRVRVVVCVCVCVCLCVCVCVCLSVRV